MPNTGPPFFATDAAEAARALQHRLSAQRRAAFQAEEQARLRGDAAKAQNLRINWMPIIERKER